MPGGSSLLALQFTDKITWYYIVLAIWAATSLATWEFLYFWPVWVIGPWGAVLLAPAMPGVTD